MVQLFYYKTRTIAIFLIVSFVQYSHLDEWFIEIHLPFEITFRKMKDRLYKELEERKWNLYF